MSTQNSYAKQNQVNSASVLVWSVLWGGSLVCGFAATRFFAPLAPILIAIVIIVHLFCAFMVLKVHLTWVKQQDELQKKIQLQSMSMTLGITWISMFLLMLLHALQLIKIGLDQLALLSILMATVGTVTTIMGRRAVL